MRNLFWAVPMLVVSFSATRGDDAKKAEALLQGTWKLVSLEIDGRPATREGKKEEPIMKVEANKFTSTLDDRHAFKGTFTVDATKTPNAVDFTVTEGEHQGKTLLGIFEVAGDDLKACYAAPGKDRPTEFTSKAGASLYKYQRVKQP